MNRFALIATAIMVLGAPAAAATAPQWTPDLVHSRAQFMVSHLVVSKVWGHIPIRQMTLVTKPGSIVPTQIDAMLDVSHEDTDNHDRDSDLRSATYFDVAQYPSITFRSTKIEPKDSENFTVTGDLTIKNVTKPVTFPVHIEGVVPDEKGGMRVGYTGDLHIDRRDWGIVDNHLTAAGVLLVGYDVEIGLTAEALTNDPSIKALKGK
jgi:polyisoprenoid-binding protein YceI